MVSRLLLLLMHPWFRLRRGMTLGVRVVVLDAENRVFLVRHGYAPGWLLPGGGVERGETIYDAMDRELVEEGGIVSGEPPALHGFSQTRRNSAAITSPASSSANSPARTGLRPSKSRKPGSSR